jgi:hypothetical protein
VLAPIAAAARMHGRSSWQGTQAQAAAGKATGSRATRPNPHSVSFISPVVLAGQAANDSTRPALAARPWAVPCQWRLFCLAPLQRLQLSSRILHQGMQ